MKRTIFCCIDGCKRKATTWKGTLVKRRDSVLAGFCDEHRSVACPNAYGRIDCYGMYYRGLQLEPSK